jgi:plastocyanin
MSHGVFRTGLALLTLMAGLHAAPSAWGASASPASISVDCGIAAGVTSTTITGQPGDTVTIANTSGSNACDFAGIAGVVTVTNLNGSNQLTAGNTATVTIVAAGAFTVTPTASSPIAGTMTIVIGNPTTQPEYDVTFNANGGTCTFNPPTISVASGDWYALPTEGTGSFQCFRENYALLGWIRQGTLLFGGSAQQAPDVPVGNQAQAADHVTLFAVWQPLGLELTLDANVAEVDWCMNSAGQDIGLAQRSETFVVPEDAIMGYALPTQAPCTPPRHILIGWATAGDATSNPITTLPDQDLGLSSLTLYAVWKNPCISPPGPGVDWRGCEFVDFAFGGLDLQGADLRGVIFSESDLSGANFSGANLQGANLDQATLTGANFTGAQMQGASLDSANLQNANLSGANLQNASMELACVIGATWTNANVENANLSGASLSVSTPPPYVGTPTGRPLNYPDYNPSMGPGPNELCMGLGNFLR